MTVGSIASAASARPCSTYRRSCGPKPKEGSGPSMRRCRSRKPSRALATLDTADGSGRTVGIYPVGSFRLAVAVHSDVDRPIFDVEARASQRQADQDAKERRNHADCKRTLSSASVFFKYLYIQYRNIRLIFFSEYRVTRYRRFGFSYKMAAEQIASTASLFSSSTQKEVRFARAFRYHSRI
jgi:hypothetical protein